ncbi:MAG: hypothetical protein PHS33_07905 [Candidatus Omnitrophica bacterium]|nr:hypothetical protein [Candidatus Omnitrophota bacterium]
MSLQKLNNMPKYYIDFVYLLKSKNQSINSISKAIGYTRTGLTNSIVKKRSSVDVCLKIAKILNVPLNDFLLTIGYTGTPLARQSKEIIQAQTSMPNYSDDYIENLKEQIEDKRKIIQLMEEKI